MAGAAPGWQELYQGDKRCFRVAGAVPGWQELLQDDKSCSRMAGAVAECQGNAPHANVELVSLPRSLRKASAHPWEGAKLEVTPPEPKPAGGSCTEESKPEPRLALCVPGGSEATFSSWLATKPQLALSPAPAEFA